MTETGHPTEPRDDEPAQLVDRVRREMARRRALAEAIRGRKGSRPPIPPRAFLPPRRGA
ncbi:MAG: hypothetical protein IRZ32_10260 [Solirubrobacteraceae bacterium]|mgnify:CR=1 FL=1|nr:hypothetical protein [Solirubrobacteraceae bacterium]